jgi:hypothetical protein
MQWAMTLACWIVGWLLGGPEVGIASDQYGNAQRRHLHAARPALVFLRRLLRTGWRENIPKIVG